MSDPTLDARILVLDQDEDYHKQLQRDFAAAGGKPTLKTPQPIAGLSVGDCQRYLSNKDYAYVGVFINPKIGQPSWTACVKFVHQYRPGTPAYVIYEDPAPKLTVAQIKQMGVQGFLKLPVAYAELLNVLQDKIEVPTTLGPAGTSDSEPAAPPVPAGLALNPEDMLAVDLKDRIGSVTSLFDLFIKLSNSRFVQVLKSGDKLTQDRLDKYKAHGAECLYILKSQREGYLKFCDQLVTDYLKDDKIPLGQKTKEIIRYGAETMDFLKSVGFGRTSLERTEKFVEKVTDIVAQIALGSPQAKEWLENIALMEHSVAVATVAGLLLRNIGVIKPETYQAVGVASLLHDIGLNGMPPEVYEEDESKMTDEQKAQFREHPSIGSKKLAQIKSLPPGVVKAVEQHHLRINGGFPAQKGFQDLSPVAEIIGISEEFSRLMKMAKDDPKLNPLEAIKAIANHNFSKSISAGLFRTLQEK